MSNELAVKNNVSIIKNVDDLGRVGKMLAMSGYFEDAKDVAQASVKVMAGMEMGFGPFASMTGIYIIKGKPSVGANLMASAVKANPKYDYRIREHNNTVCKIEFFEIVNGQRESLGISEFTAKDAQVANVKNMTAYARNMLFARAMSNGIKWFCPDVFDGNPTYVPEELGAVVDGEGNVISIDGEETKAQTTVVEAPAQVIEAEIVEPINPTPEEQKPVEAQEEAKFDEVNFLRGWTHRSDLPSMTLEAATLVQTSKGKDFGKCTVQEFAFMLNAYQRRLNNPNNSADVKEDAQLKLSAINEILTAKANALQQLEMPKDPSLNKEA